MITLDKEFEYPKYSDICTFCKHLKNNGINRKCKAFLKGIPDKIWLGKNKHLKPVKNQKNKIVFEAAVK